MDPLSQIIALLRPHAAISKPITGRGRWGVRYAAYDAPGFTIILKGACWISIAGQEATQLAQGDFLLLPSTPAFSLSSHPGIPCEPRMPASTAIRHGEQDGDADFESLGGSFGIEPANAPLLLSLLPRVIYIPATEGRAERLSRVIGLIMEECAGEAPGKQMILQRLLEVLLVEAMRWRHPATGDMQDGLLGAMHDPALARALRAMHAEVRSDWTVAALAKLAGLSRSAFAARFSKSLGCGPMDYLARWRMALAKDALMRGEKTLDQIADEIGYESASAFSTAFRKRLGCPPGRYARQGNKPEIWTIKQ